MGPLSKEKFESFFLSIEPYGKKGHEEIFFSKKDHYVTFKTVPGEGKPLERYTSYAIFTLFKRAEQHLNSTHLPLLHSLIYRANEPEKTQGLKLCEQIALREHLQKIEQLFKKSAFKDELFPILRRNYISLLNSHYEFLPKPPSS